MGDLAVVLPETVDEVVGASWAMVATGFTALVLELVVVVASG
jgi:hypothetical protein